MAVDGASAEHARFGERAEPCALVIFGASGDLTRRMLLPALYALAHDELLPEGTVIVGCGRTEKTDDEWREEMREACASLGRLPVDASLWNRFAATLHYHTADPTTDEGAESLCAELGRIDETGGTGGNRLFYLATPPSVYAPILEHLESGCMLQPQAPDARPYARVVIEKPVGRDLRSARELHAITNRVMNEDQLYRIDHYLGKETVQNIMVLRFANAIFEPVWNQQFVEYVEITAAESIGVGTRGAFYEEAGVLRDIVQNHLLQVLSLVAMEPPLAYSAPHVRDARSQVLRALRPLDVEDVPQYVVRGQYGPGSIDGEQVCGYREEKGVDPASLVPTYMAMRLDIDNWRWSGVPFYLRAGKRLATRVTEVAVHFKDVPYNLFSTQRSYARPNVLICRIQPDEGVHMQFALKIPGDELHIHTQDMDFSYQETFGGESPRPYERLLLDCMQGDPTLFPRRDAVELAWEYVEPILESWARRTPDRFPDYPAGSWGPRHADQLLARDGRIWREP